MPWRAGEAEAGDTIAAAGGGTGGTWGSGGPGALAAQGAALGSLLQAPRRGFRKAA
jgi:hypothetical protein